jgi:hypothetical protein
MQRKDALQDHTVDLEVILQARVEEVGDLSDGNAIGCS